MGLSAASPCVHVFDRPGSRCVSVAGAGLWDLPAGTWLFEVTFAGPCRLPFKVCNLSGSVSQKLKSSILVVYFPVFQGIFSL